MLRVASSLVLKDTNKDFYNPIMNLLWTGASALTKSKVKGADIMWLRIGLRSFFSCWQGKGKARISDAICKLDTIEGGMVDKSVQEAEAAVFIQVRDGSE